VILEKNGRPFNVERNSDVIRNCELGLAACPPESYWNWGGLRAEFEALEYVSESLGRSSGGVQTIDPVRWEGVETPL
jgi:hypothetical protein